MTQNDGGPAFPRGASEVADIDPGAEGVSLRDYFAASAISGLISDVSRHGDGGYEGDADWIASEAYSIADAMIAERGETQHVRGDRPGERQ